MKHHALFFACFIGIMIFVTPVIAQAQTGYPVSDTAVKAEKEKAEKAKKALDSLDPLVEQYFNEKEQKEAAGIDFQRYQQDILDDLIFCILCAAIAGGIGHTAYCHRKGLQRMWQLYGHVIPVRNMKIAVSAYALWILLLLFTNSFEFENIFRWYQDDMRRLRLLAILPPVFVLVAYLLFRWTFKPEKHITGTASREILPVGLAKTEIHAVNFTGFYLKRGLYLVLWSFLLLFFISGFAAAAKIQFYRVMYVFFAGLFFIATALFSRPLGFWRKIACCLAAMVVYLIVNWLLGYIFVFALPSLLNDNPGDAFVAASRNAFLLAIGALFLAQKVQFVLQGRWRVWGLSAIAQGVL